MQIIPICPIWIWWTVHGNACKIPIANSGSGKMDSAALKRPKGTRHPAPTVSTGPEVAQVYSKRNPMNHSVMDLDPSLNRESGRGSRTWRAASGWKLVALEPAPDSLL